MSTSTIYNIKPCRIEPFYGTLTKSKICRVPDETFKRLFPGNRAYNVAKTKYLFHIVSEEEIGELSDDELQSDIERVLQSGVYFERLGHVIRYNTLARNLTTLVEEKYRRCIED